MEPITFICYKCGQMNDDICKCAHCGFDRSEDQVLANIILSKYNEAIKLKDKKKIVKAWEITKQNIFIYPFIIEQLNLAFLLAVQNGEYDIAKGLIERLRGYLGDQYQELYDMLKEHVSIYNQILEREIGIEDSRTIDFSLFHLYVLFMQASRENKKRILNKLRKIDPYFTSSLILGPRIPSSYYWIGLSVLLALSIAGNGLFFMGRKDLKQNISNIEQINKEYLTKLKDIRGVLNNLEKNKTTLASDKAKLEKQVTLLQDKNEQLNKETNGLKDKQDQLIQDIKNLQDKNKKLEEEVKQLEPQVTEGMANNEG